MVNCNVSSPVKGTVDYELFDPEVCSLLLALGVALASHRTSFFIYSQLLPQGGRVIFQICYLLGDCWWWIWYDNVILKINQLSYDRSRLIISAILLCVLRNSVNSPSKRICFSSTDRSFSFIRIVSLRANSESLFDSLSRSFIPKNM